MITYGPHIAISFQNTDSEKMKVKAFSLNVFMSTILLIQSEEELLTYATSHIFTWMKQ